MSGQGSVRQDASGKWLYVVDVKSAAGRRQQSMKRGFPTKKEAQRALTELLHNVQTNQFVRPAKTTLAGYLDEWLEGLPASGRRPSTIDSYAQNVRRNVVPYIGGIELQQLDATDLDRMYAQLLKRGLSMRTVRYVHSILGKALSDAERRKRIANNPSRLATPPLTSATVTHEMTVWLPIELRRFLDGIRDHDHYPLIRTAAMTGLRRGELCALRWNDLNLEAGTVAVRKSTTSVGGKAVTGDVKTKRSNRVIDVDPETVAALKTWKKRQTENRLVMGAGWADTGLVFTMPTGEAWRPDTISQAFDRLVRPIRRNPTAEQTAALLPRIRFHDLRHTHASHLLAAGVNVKVVSERLGHASVAFTLDVYAHVMPGQQASAAAAAAALVDSL